MPGALPGVGGGGGMLMFRIDRRISTVCCASVFVRISLLKKLASVKAKFSAVKIKRDKREIKTLKIVRSNYASVNCTRAHHPTRATTEHLLML